MDSWRLKECTDLQRDMMAGSCGGRVYTIKETENKGGCPFFDWQPVKCSEKRPNVLMSAFEKYNTRYVVLNINTCTIIMHN